jgi:hypothetical protein
MLTTLGVPPANIDNNGVEGAGSFERILSHKTTRGALGEPMPYELESLLVGRLGASFRNSIAHGLLTPDTLNSDIAFYQCWLLLRLMVPPTRRFTEFIECQGQSIVPKASSS